MARALLGPGYDLRRSAGIRVILRIQIPSTFGFAFGSWPGATLMPALLLPACLYRIWSAERALPAARGVDYAAYMRTGRLVPGLW